MKHTIPIILLVLMFSEKLFGRNAYKRITKFRDRCKSFGNCPQNMGDSWKTVFENFSDLRGYGHFKEFFGAVVDDHHTYSIHVNELNHSEFLVVFSKTLRISGTLGVEGAPKRLRVLLDTLLVVNSEPNWVFSDPPCFLENKNDPEIFALVNSDQEAIRHESTFKA